MPSPEYVAHAQAVALLKHGTTMLHLSTAGAICRASSSSSSSDNRRQQKPHRSSISAAGMLRRPSATTKAAATAVAEKRRKSLAIQRKLLLRLRHARCSSSSSGRSSSSDDSGSLGYQQMYPPVKPKPRKSNGQYGALPSWDGASSRYGRLPAMRRSSGGLIGNLVCTGRV